MSISHSACRWSTGMGRPMIDYLRCRVPITLPRPIDDGCSVVFDINGVALRRTPFRKKLPSPGSYSASLHVRSVSSGELEIEGNPVKWLQGHNLYGTDDLPALLWTALEHILKSPEIGTTLAQCGIRSLHDIDATVITRVDLTYMLALETPGDVQAWIRSAYSNGSANRRGRGVMKGATLVFGDAEGKSFTRWQIVIYSKGQEIEAHPLPAFMMNDPAVLQWVQRALRVEVRLGRLELEKQGLRRLAGWLTSADAPPDTPSMWRSKVAQLDFNNSAETHFDLETLPRSLRAVFVAWQAGADPRNLLSRPTFYRYRRQLQDVAGVDIAIPLPPAPPTAQIVPIKRVLEARPAGRPDWADRIDAELRAAGHTVLSSAA